MPHLIITHSTEQAYRNPVGLLRHCSQMRPHQSRDLRLRAATLSVEPAPAVIRWALDVVGNSARILDWATETGTILLRSVAALWSANYPLGAATPDPGNESLPLSQSAEGMVNQSRLTERQFPDGVVDGWACGFVSASTSPHTLGLLEAMTQSIQHSLRFAARDAGGMQTPAEPLTMGSRTRRECAMLMMEAARRLGLAARFVAGYLYQAGAQAVRCGGAMHAWCAVYLPGAGWVEYDPSEGFLAGDDLIPVGSGPCAISGAASGRWICGCPHGPQGTFGGCYSGGHAGHCGLASRVKNGG